MMYGKKETYQESVKRRMAEKAIKDAQLNKSSLARATAERQQRGARIEKRSEYRDLLKRENKKMANYYSKGGKRENVSEVYLRNLDKLKHIDQGTRRPLDMIDVFGRQ